MHEDRAREIGGPKLCPVEFCAREVGLIESRSVEDDVTKVSVNEARAETVTLPQVRALKLRVLEACTAETRARSLHSAQIRLVKVSTTKVSIEEERPCERCPIERSVVETR